MKKRKIKVMGMLTLVLFAVFISFCGNTAAAQAAKTAINKKSLTIKVGESKTLRITNITKAQNKSVVWRSSNKQTATVNQKGKVTGRRAGTARITARVNQKKYLCKLTVIEKEKAGDDHTRLQKIIAQQITKGANIPKSLNSEKYTWDGNERLIKIDWESKGVTGTIDFSSFTKLQEISIGNNKQLTTCNTTGLTALKSLDIWRCSIEQIDVSSNIHLTYLNVIGNQLTTLDVTNNTNLTDLGCSDNSLTGLELSKNANLTGLDCSNNPLKSLDISQQAQLQNLYCENCQLTSLDISSNLLLTTLYCPKNQLTSLDISKNLQLMELHCFENALTSLDVSKNIRLQMLNCRRNQISTLDVSTLAQGGEGSTYCYVGCDPGVVVTGAERPPVTSTVDANNNIIVTGNVLSLVQN